MKFFKQTLLFSLVVFSISAKSQVNVRLTQYSEVLSLYNASFAGIENHTDFRFGLRRQWTNIDNAPLSFFTHLSGTISTNNKNNTRRKKYKSPYDIDQMINMVPVPNNGLRTSNPHLYRSLVRDSIVTAVKKLDRKARINLRRQLKAKNTLRYSARHGYTGTLLSQQNGALTQFSLNGGYAYHLPISHQLMLSTGLGVTLINSRFDSNKAMVADPTNDPLYQQYATGGMNDYAVYINPGINVYNDKFYASYSISKIASQSVGDNSFISTQNTETVHHLAMGTFLNINQHVSIHPAFLLSIKESSPYSTLFSTKVFYEEQLWLGLHYSLQDAAAASFGLFFKDQYKFSYTFEFPGVNNRQELGTTHEIVFGILISKGSSPNPYIK